MNSREPSEPTEQTVRHRPSRPLGRVFTVVVALAALSTALVLGADAGRATGVRTAGPWQPPVSGAVLDRFDPPARPWLAGHRGIDLAAAAGAPVVAPAAGIVTFAGQVGGKPVVVVSHGELRSTLEPVLARRDVGDQVPAGAAVGVVAPDVADSHCAPAHCVHWGVRRQDVYLDPLALLGLADPIVLLPLP